MNLKSSFIITFLFIVALRVGAQIKVEASETVELMGIVSRIAGFREFSMDLAGQYTKDTDAWFSKHKEHPFIAYYQGLRANHGISYDAVMSMAVHLDINKGRVKFLGEKFDLEKRWNNIDIDDFVIRLNQFYRDTRFHDFYEQHHTFYDNGLKDYETHVLAYFHQDWYAQFYGTDNTDQFRIIICFTYGDNNNGVSRQLKGQPREVFSICGYKLNQMTGQPFWDASILIHEFNHSFVNPLLESTANVVLMENIGRKLFQLSQFEMQQQAYNDWNTVINESVVRAAVFIYMIDNKLLNRNTSQFMLNEMYRRGFRWMPELVVALRKYSSNRE